MRVKKIVLSLEKEIVDDLVKNEKVRLDGFGLFYLLKRKSRVIKQIRTKNTRLLLGQKTVRFRAGSTVKNALTGKSIPKPRPKVKAIEKTEPEAQTKKVQSVEVKRVKETLEPHAPRRFKPLELKPVKMHQRADREKVRSIIIERFLRLARQPGRSEENPMLRPALDTSAEGKLFQAIFKMLMKGDAKKLSFSLEQSDQVTIFQTSPRKRITNLPKSTVKRFLERYLDFNETGLPQERFVKLALNSKIKTKITIHAYSIPTAGGESFNIIIG
jgi:nucleoid DNA-binding protein